MISDLVTELKLVPVLWTKCKLLPKISTGMISIELQLMFSLNQEPAVKKDTEQELSMVKNILTREAIPSLNTPHG